MVKMSTQLIIVMLITDFMHQHFTNLKTKVIGQIQKFRGKLLRSWSKNDCLETAIHRQFNTVIHCCEKFYCILFCCTSSLQHYHNHLCLNTIIFKLRAIYRSLKETQQTLYIALLRLMDLLANERNSRNNGQIYGEFL